MKNKENIELVMGLIGKSIGDTEIQGTDFCVALSMLAVGSMTKLGISKEEMIEIMSSLYDSWDSFEETANVNKQI